MGKDVTIIGKDETGYVTIGILEQTGRRFYHVRLIDGALVGGTTPNRETSKILKDDVEVLEGFRYDLLSNYVARTQSALLWQAERQTAVIQIEADAAARVEKQVALAIKKWEKDHPRQDITGVMPRPDPEPEPDPVPVPAGEPDSIAAQPDAVNDSKPFPPNEPVPPAWDVGAGVLVKDTFDFVQIVQADFTQNKWQYICKDDDGELKSYWQDQLESTEGTPISQEA